MFHLKLFVNVYRKRMYLVFSRRVTFALYVFLFHHQPVVGPVLRLGSLQQLPGRIRS